ncbi:MAG: SUMF1/EgtB/PvdO family nonheme iron enzyme, partial [Verrucomicrobia bacterium]|nr:SUMF1/EgtB/PvdO family nonheme iron enzyme [Verrucomicrobiota bacterium]
LYQMLTGRTPYEGSDPMTVMGLHVNAPPPAMFKTWPQCPMPLALLVGKMLKKNPRERYASYDELIAELTAVHDKIKAAQTASAAPPSGTITFLFTDIEGSTQLWEKHPQAMPVALERHNQILRRTMESHGGFVFKTVGDAFCVAFASAPNAMAAALAAQRALSAEPWGETGPLRVRMALHTGAAEERGGDYFGPTVNRVARVLAAGHGGQILLSNATEQLVRDHLAEGVSLGDLGERSLKNLTRTERIFQINLPDLPTQFPTLRSAAGPSTTRRRRQRMMTYGGAGAAAVVVVLAGFLLWSPWQSRTGVPPVQSTTTGQAGRLSYSNEAALKLLGNVYTNAVGAEMVYIPPGEFMMGSTKEEQAWAAANGGKGERVMFEGETPRKATINQGFWMGRTEVTVGQWKQFVKATGYVTDGEKKGESSVYLGSGKSHAPKKGVNWRNPDFGFEMQDDHPVSCISWNDAVAFCEWLTDRERKAGRAAAGMVVRLPTEVEWEYACRAGTQSKFWWGDSKEDGKGRLNWFGKNDGFEFVASVDSFGVRGRNRFGLADMLGNVAEWCLDDYDATQAHEELWTGNSATHVVRAGSFNSSPSISRCAYRHSASRFSSYNSMGFRFCVGVDVSGARAATASASRGVDDVFLREVAALPAEQQVARVVAKLKELNPGFDGKETHKIKNGEVTELAFLTEAVTDISPVRALKALQELDCGNSYSPPGLLADLTPLRGMALRSFCIVRTKVADLSPLKGMPLQSLSCGGNRITDLSPLQDMPLRSLFVGITEVQDLSPLKGMALTSLSCYSTQVTDLSVLRGMPLKSLTFDFIAARDIEILRSFKSLEQINYLPAAEFWKRVAAGETPKPIISSAAALKLLGNVYTNAVGAEMVYIPPGEFMLGSTKEEQEWAVANGRKESEVKREGEAPRRAVIKQGFWMGRTEVTVGQWKQFVKETGYVTDGEKKGESNVHQAPGKPPAPMKGKSWRNPDFGFEPLDDHPVSCISWNDAVAFCEWLTDRERKAGRAAAGMVVRLPTEVEWEYACRAGRDTKFWWGDSKEDGKSRLNCWGKGDGFEFVAPVDSFRERGRNRFGLADMLGNVYEWCLDICDATQAHEDLWTGNPSARVLRGGSFASVPAGCRCAFRSAYSPSESDSSFGFRLVVGVDLSGATTATASTSRGVDDTFLREVAALPAEQQVARVVAKLKQLNPGFDGQETHNIEDGQVTELAFRSATVADLSPVRALKALRTLQCGGVQGKGSLADLSPLRGMQLEKLVMQFSKVTDLSPLKGMPLRHLSCLFSKIRDLDALRGMPLTFLTCGHSAVHDLSPLEGMALTSLDFHRSPVSDLSPIKTMPLESLNLDFVPKRDTEIVHSVKSLKKINRLPVAEFWKRVEAGTIPVCCGGKGKAEAATEEESAAAATSAGENWQDWMAEQRQSGKTPPGFNDDGTGWVKTKPGMIKLGNSMRDGAARATFTLLDQEAGGAAIGLRSTKDQASCQGSVRQKTAFLQLLKPLPEGQPTDSPRGVKVLKQWPLPPGIDLNREITLEFRAIGEELSFKVNGQLVGMVRDSTCNQEGEVTIYARELGARVSRIEVLNLDGASLSPAAAPKDGGILAPTKTRVSALTTNPKVGEVFTLEVGKGVTMELMGIP